MRNSSTSLVFGRRQLLRGVGCGAVAAAVPSLLSACTTAVPAPTAPGTPTSPPVSTPAAAGGVLPTYAPAPNRPTPDFASTGPLSEDAYINYPQNPFKSVADPPGTGGDVKAFVALLMPPPTPFDQNPAWKEVNRQLNANFQFNMVATADQQTRLAALMAGNDLPDIINVFRGINGIANLPPFLQSKCADLTPHLAGDAAKEYPFLAAIPSFAWRNSGSIVGNQILMVPIQRYAPGTIMYKNAGIYDTEIGAEYVPKDFDDYKRVLQQLNRPSEGRYATGAYQGVAFNVDYYAAALGAPNNWMVDPSGKFVKAWETQQYRDATAFARDLVAAGLYHPNTLTNTTFQNGQDDLVAGRTAIYILTFGNPWVDTWRKGLVLQNPVDVLFVPPFPAHAGDKPAHFFQIGFQSATALKQAVPERVKELLRILNYLSAPFGSAEDLLLTAGVKDVDYSLDANGNPRLSDRGNMDATNVPWKYIVQRPQVIYQPDLPRAAKIMYDAEQLLIPIGVSDPSLGLYSPTATSKGVPVDKAFNDGLSEIIAGRRPLSDYDQLLGGWQASAGNQIRTELMQAMHQANG
jgi:putative aldouronate transport system substrate-binding protein